MSLFSEYERKYMKEKIKDFLLVTLGAFISAIGLNGFMAENNIISGGIGGLALSMQALVGWNPGDFALIINIPLLILCYIFLGRSVFISTLYGSWIFPIFIKLTATIPSFTNDRLLAAIFGSTILGIGLGFVFMGNSSTGGTSIPVKIINQYTPLSLGLAMTIVDGLVVLTGLIAFKNVDVILYSIIALLIVSYVVNLMLTGLQSSKNILIISEKSSLIKQQVSQATNRGITEIPIFGGYTGTPKKMLMITVSTFEVPTIEHTIQGIDPTAFIIIMPASQVMGRGFSLTKNFKLPDEDVLPPI